MSRHETPWDRSGGDAAAPDRVLIFTEHVNATYFISFEIPLTEIARRRPIAWWTIASTSVDRLLAGTELRGLLEKLTAEVHPTCVVLTRYAVPAGPGILAFFQDRGVRCIYHLDDDLLHLPPALGADILARHGQADVVAARHDLVARADLVYASTGALVQVLQRQFPHQRFTTGIYRAYEPAQLEERNDASPILIGYMGSRGHAEDLEIAVPALVCLLREHGEAVRFELFGTIPFPHALEPFRASVSHHKATPDYFAFRHQLHQLRWHIGLAPLADNVFNRCKAPTKFIEYTEAGTVTIASDVQVYRQYVTSSDAEPAAVLCGDESWYRSLVALIADAHQRADLLRRARACCERNFSRHALAAQVQQVLAPLA